MPLPTAQKLMGQLAASRPADAASVVRAAALRWPGRRSEISLADIVEAVEGPIAMTMCSDASDHDCALDAHCRVKPHMGIVGNAVRGALGAVSLQLPLREELAQ